MAELPLSANCTAAPLPQQWHDWVEGSLAGLRQAQQLRMLRPLYPLCSGTEALVHSEDLAAWADGVSPVRHYASPPNPSQMQRMKLYSLNDYLGLASHPEVCAAAASAARMVGMGYRSSGLVAGYSSEHRALEQALADLKGTEDCLLFPTGFAANMGTLAALASSNDVAIYSDSLNHASIIDGARLANRSGGQLHVYRHNDLAHLEELLRAAPPTQRRLVVTDSLFSMDGDFADLKGLAQLKARHDFLLVVDEAHATLVCGQHGGGAAEAMGVADQVDVHIGTLSKAFGALGGFAACSRSVKSYLLNRGRPFVYSTALPLPIVAAASAGLAVSNRESWRRRHVWQLVEALGEVLQVPALSPIIPLVIGGEAETLAASSALLRMGIHAPAIRPPTVAPGTCRLRISLSSAHSMSDIQELATLVQSQGIQLQQLPHLLAQQASGVAACCSSTSFRMGRGWNSCSSGDERSDRSQHRVTGADGSLDHEADHHDLSRNSSFGRQSGTVQAQQAVHYDAAVLRSSVSSVSAGVSSSNSTGLPAASCLTVDVGSVGIDMQYDEMGQLSDTWQHRLTPTAVDAEDVDSLNWESGCARNGLVATTAVPSRL